MKNFALLLLLLTTIPSLAISSKSNNSSVKDAIASYNFENNTLDSSGINHGKATKIDYAEGVIGQAASFNGERDARGV